MADGTHVVVLQHDLLEDVGTRVVAPLLEAGRFAQPMRGLNPEVRIGDTTFVLIPQFMATLAIGELGERMGSIAHLRDEVTRAVDILLGGV